MEQFAFGGGFGFDMSGVGASVPASSATLVSSSTVTHNGRTFDVERTSDGAAVDVYTAPDGSPVVISYGVNVTITPQTASSVVSGSFSDTGTYTDRTVNGTMLNPGNVTYATGGLRANNYYGGPQGWDSLPDVTYDAGNNIASATITEGTVVQAVYEPSPPSHKRSSIQTYAMVTVVETAPANDTYLRPAQSSSTKTWPGSTTTVRAYVDSITTRAAPASWVDNVADLIAALGHPEQVHYTFGDAGRDIFPANRTDWNSGYGRDYGKIVASALLALQYSDVSLANRYELAELLVQVGIDINERTYEQGGQYPGNGGLDNGRWALALFAATVLNDATMLANVDAEGTTYGVANVGRWHETGQIDRVASGWLDYRAKPLELPSLATATDGTGYTVDDILTLGGIALDGTAATYRATAVDGSGGVTTVAEETAGYHLLPPATYAVTGGSGSGCVLGSRPGQLYSKGMIGTPEWGGNLRDPVSPGDPNAHLSTTYRVLNHGPGISQAHAFRGLPGMIANANADDFIEWTDRAWGADISIIAAERPLPDVTEEFEAQRGSGDVTAPAISLAEVNENILFVRFDELLREAAADRPVAGDFTIEVDSTPVSLATDGFQVWGYCIIFALATPLTGGETVTISYTKGTSPAVIQDIAGNETASFTDQAVTNQTLVPTLTLPTDAGNGETASTGSVTTDTGSGTLYWVITESSTTPSAAQVKAGQDDSGSAAADSGSQAVSGTGVQPITGSGLTTETTYYTHFMQELGSGAQSNVASADGFTTAAVSALVVDEGSSDGTFSSSGGYRIWTAANGDNLVVTTEGKPTGVEIVAGGGGGGGRDGGGGGGGEVVQKTDAAAPTLTVTSHAAVVGAGGAGGSSANGTAGSNSSFGGLTALGGGLGPTRVANGGAGGSGGGCSAGSASGAGGASTASDGVGSTGGGSSSSGAAGGGGGAGSVGGAGSGTVSGNGGSGVASIVPGGTSTTLAAGGGGGATTTAGTGGTGDGTGNGQPVGGAATAGGATTGSGGGGGNGTFGERTGAAGGTGRVKVWWPE